MRVLKVIALLVVLGAASGALMGLMLLFGISLLGPGRLSAVTSLNITGMAAGLGALVGGITGPPLAWIFLRRVPLWRATVETAGAAGIGAAVGMTIKGIPYGWAYGALLFAILAAIRLHRVYRKEPSRAQANEEL
jgi:MFS family permease